MLERCARAELALNKKGPRFQTLKLLVTHEKGLTFGELVQKGISESTLIRALRSLTEPNAKYVAKPPKRHGGKCVATDAGRARCTEVTAKGPRR